MMALIALVLVLFIKESQQGREEKRLLSTLFSEGAYNKLERPVADDKEPLIVNFSLTLQQIIDVDEKNQIIHTNLWLNIKWNDYNLVWNPQEYDNISSLRISANHIWRPDILMYNSADEDIDSTFPTNVVVSSNGNCLWVPPGMFASTCKIDISWFPFDDQRCKMKFGSWTYDSSGINLILQNDTGDVSNFIPSGEWDLIGMPATRNVLSYDCCPEQYIDITFVIHIRRRFLYYAFNLIIPCILISSMALLTFTLPPDAGEKISLGVTVLLSLTVFLLLVAETMPPTADAVPLIGSYFAGIMLMCSLSVVCTVLVLNFHHRSPDTHGMPYWVRIGVCQWLAKVVRMKRPNFEEVTQSHNCKDYDDYNCCCKKRSSNVVKSSIGKNLEENICSTGTETAATDRRTKLSGLDLKAQRPKLSRNLSTQKYDYSNSSSGHYFVEDNTNYDSYAETTLNESIYPGVLANKVDDRNLMDDQSSDEVLAENSLTGGKYQLFSATSTTLATATSVDDYMLRQLQHHPTQPEQQQQQHHSFQKQHSVSVMDYEDEEIWTPRKQTGINLNYSNIKRQQPQFQQNFCINSFDSDKNAKKKHDRGVYYKNTSGKERHILEDNKTNLKENILLTNKLYSQRKTPTSAKFSPTSVRKTTLFASNNDIKTYTTTPANINRNFAKENVYDHRPDAFLSLHAAECDRQQQSLQKNVNPLESTQFLASTKSEQLLLSILNELKFATNKIRNDDMRCDMCNDWKFAAMVVDRLCLWLFTVFTLGSTAIVFLSAPHVVKYD